MTLKQVLEALVFASPKPLLTREIMAALRSAADAMEEDSSRTFGKATEEQVVDFLEQLGREYAESGRAFRLVEQVNGWTLVTEPMAAPWVRQLYPEAKPTRLSGPALETLAIIAYRQPVTRADIEAVRGVAVDGVMQVLLDRSLVKIAGRAEVPGRPLLYSTTEYFLQHFGLKNVGELPNAGELRRIPLPQAPAPEATEALPQPVAGTSESTDVPATVGSSPESVSSGSAEPNLEPVEGNAADARPPDEADDLPAAEQPQS
jgi:segregation and condensation protein B